MKKIMFSIAFVLQFCFSVVAQEEDIIKTIDDFFVAMESKDTVAMDILMHPQCMIFSTAFDENKGIKNEVLMKASLLGFMKRAIDKKIIFDEKLWTYEVSVEDNIATVWTEYTMFVGKELDQVSHCGVNAFTLVRNPQNQWVITNITDTRRNHDCIESAEVNSAEATIHQLMDNWHLAAADADSAAFFGAMTDNGIYLGTDASERWTRDEFAKWAAFAFNRESAWSFKAANRTIYFSKNQKTAWFEESLDTWMGPCRGSGVVTRENGVWKIQHYDLSIMVPNDLVNCFIHLVDKGVCKKKRKK